MATPFAIVGPCERKLCWYWRSSRRGGLRSSVEATRTYVADHFPPHIRTCNLNMFLSDRAIRARPARSDERQPSGSIGPAAQSRKGLICIPTVPEDPENKSPSFTPLADTSAAEDFP